MLEQISHAVFFNGNVGAGGVNYFQVFGGYTNESLWASGGLLNVLVSLSSEFITATVSCQAVDMILFFKYSVSWRLLICFSMQHNVFLKEFSNQYLLLFQETDKPKKTLYFKENTRF